MSKRVILVHGPGHDAQDDEGYACGGQVDHGSSASDSKPTEPVIQYAYAFKPMMTRAAAIESQAK